MSHDTPCPHCGYCPSCGRSNTPAIQLVPQYPWWYQQPIQVTYGTTTSGSYSGSLQGNIN